MTPEQLDSLRRQLPPFGETALAGEPLKAFCRFYNLDFTVLNPALKHDAGIVRSGKYDLAVHYWQQPGATANLLLVHGYFDHTGLFNKLIAWALSRNCNVLIFDLPGHGLSSGAPAVIDDFGAYSLAIHDVLQAARLPELPLWVMAQSTGGAALVDFANKYPWPFAATVLLAPLIRPASWSKVRLAYFLLRPVLQQVPRKFAVNSSDSDFLDFLKRDPLQCRQISLRWIGALNRWLGKLQREDLGVGPALIVQGDADATVDWRYNTDFIATLFPGSQLEYLPGAGHQLANESTVLRRSYLARVETYLAKSGITLAESSGVQSS